MKWCFWRKEPPKQEIILQISASEGNIQTLYVKAQGKDEAVELMEKLKELAKGK
jgi:hypothetical protein